MPLQNKNFKISVITKPSLKMELEKSYANVRLLV
jgi:hypothetical protein